MTHAIDSDGDAVRTFVESTRNLVAQLEGLDPSGLERSIEVQLESFEALRLAMSEDAFESSTELGEVLTASEEAAGRAALRMQEIRGEIDQLRTARARVDRSKAAEIAAQFVSRRV